jgi:hypothetical protein
MKRDFVEQGREEMHDFVVKAINDLLAILDSKIEYPTNKDGAVLEHKLFAVVQSREQVFKSATSLMDLIKLDESSDQRYKNKVIEGLKTTWHELTILTTRDIGEYNPSSEELHSENYKELSEEERKQKARESITDDYLSSISKAKELSAKVAYQILDRIEKLENPDKINEEILRNSQGSNIIEEFVEN